MTPTIQIPHSFRNYLELTLGAHPPEHYCILLRRTADDPFKVKECHIMPPNFEGGRMNAGRAHIQLNPQAIEYQYNVDWRPRGLEIIGALHTHPGDFNRLSGSADSAVGDIGAMRTILKRAAALNKSMPHFLAPIMNMTPSGVTFTGWIVTLGQPEPIKADIVWRDDGAPSPIKENALFARARRHVGRLNQIDQMPELSGAQRRLVKTALRRSFNAELAALIGVT